jgi:hypothetical protein
MLRYSFVKHFNVEGSLPLKEYMSERPRGWYKTERSREPCLLHADPDGESDEACFGDFIEPVSLPSLVAPLDLVLLFMVC